MSSIPRWLLRHQLTIEAYAGTAGTGQPTYASAVTVRGFLAPKRRFVRDGQGARVLVNASAVIPRSAVCPVQSRVTGPDGTVHYVLVVTDGDGVGLPTPDHQQIDMT